MNYRFWLAMAGLLLVMSRCSIGLGFQLPGSYNEAVQGDLSDDPMNPSALADGFLPAFILQGTLQGTDYDIFTVDLQNTGITLDQIILEGYAGPAVSFMAVQEGATWTAGLGGAVDASALLGWSHFGSSDLGSDLLAAMSTGPGAMGFTPPLEESVYTFLVQDIGQNVNYTLRLEADHELQPDIDDDGMLTVTDLDALVGEIVAGSHHPAYDYNCDGVLDLLDVDEWLAFAGAANLPSQAPYLVGDANLDGAVDGSDFLAWNQNKFSPQAAWSSGDFDASGVVDGLDFLAWNANKFQTADFAAVPEPSMLGCWLALLFLKMRRSGH